MDRKLIKRKANFKTQCVHAGELVDKVNGGSISPYLDVLILHISLVLLRQTDTPGILIHQIKKVLLTK